VESHIKACLDGSLPNISRKKSIFCTRLILYSPKRVKVPNLTHYLEVRDIPVPESIIEKGEPLCSILTMGKSRGSSIQKAEKLVGLIYSMLSPA
jgi:predicted ATP-grasp superfamily ATP-dependent carboligase